MMFKLFEGENAKPSVNVIKNRGKPINYFAHSHPNLRQHEGHGHSIPPPPDYRCGTRRSGWRKGHHCRKCPPQAVTAGCHTFAPTESIFMKNPKEADY